MNTSTIYVISSNGTTLPDAYTSLQTASATAGIPYRSALKQIKATSKAIGTDNGNLVAIQRCNIIKQDKGRKDAFIVK